MATDWSLASKFAQKRQRHPLGNLELPLQIMQHLKCPDMFELSTPEGFQVCMNCTGSKYEKFWSITFFQMNFSIYSGILIFVSNYTSGGIANGNGSVS